MKFQPLLAGTLLLAPTLALAQSNQAPTPAEIFSQGRNTPMSKSPLR